MLLPMRVKVQPRTVPGPDMMSRRWKLSSQRQFCTTQPAHS